MEQISLKSPDGEPAKQNILTLKSKSVFDHYEFGAFNLSWNAQKDSIDFLFRVKVPKKYERNFWAAFGLSKDAKMVCLIIIHLSK